MFLLIFILPFVSFSEDSHPEEITNAVEMKFRLIPAGVFVMGSSSGDIENGEQPTHLVLISKPFYIGVYEVTNKQYNWVMKGSEGGGSTYDNHPKQNISWEKAREFCKRLSEKEGVTYRLPTEAEWEYACRAGSNYRFYWGDKIDISYAWWGTGGNREPIPVGQKKPNKWGLYDMSGNVSEWCEDWWETDFYSFDFAIDPTGPQNGSKKVQRGGSIGRNMGEYYTSFYRDGFNPKGSGPGFGFRCVREIPDIKGEENLEKFQTDVNNLSSSLFFNIKLIDWHKTVFEKLKQKERWGIKPPLVKVKMMKEKFIIKLGELRSMGTFLGYIEYENLGRKVKKYVGEKGYGSGDTVTFKVENKVASLVPKELKINKKLLNKLVGKNVELKMKTQSEPQFAKITDLLQKNFVHVFKIQVQGEDTEKTVKLENIEAVRVIVDLKQR